MPAAVIIGAGMAIGGIATGVGSMVAAHSQEKAAAQASATQQAQYNQTRGDEMPYMQEGQTALNNLQAQSGYLNSPFNPTQQQLESTPGYQFTLSQGLKSVNNAMGARGLLNSGAAMKGASQYATGLADSTYLDQFNVDQANKNNIYNRLMGEAQLGNTAAGQTGQFGYMTAHDIAGNQIGAGNAAAAGAMGLANGFGQAANGIATAFLPSNFLQTAMLGQAMSRGGIYGASAGSRSQSGSTYYGNSGGYGGP